LPVSGSRQSTAYFTSGLLPRRPRGLDRRLPTIGNGKYEWLGYLQERQHPHDVSGPDGLLLNWNNQSAPGFMHGDDEPYGSVQRVENFDKWPAKPVITDNVGIMNRAATEDVRASAWPVISRALRRGDAPSARDQQVLDILDDWVDRDAPRIDVDRMAKKARGLQFVDGSPTIWALRQVKSAAEIDRIRVACTIASDAYDEVTSMTKAGDTTRQAELALRTMIMQKGADHVPFIATAAGQGGYAQIIAGPGEHKLKKGDVLFHDVGCTYDGYFCDFDRNFAVGKISDDARRIHDALWLATEAGIKAARPGATMQDVFHVMAKFLEDAGSIGNNVGRIGHGLGLHLTEPPSFMQGNLTPIVPGMVLTIEPGMAYAPGKMLVHEENLAIGESRNEILTRRAPREMPVIG
jgi:Xaa-Pro aminopeptidase